MACSFGRAGGRHIAPTQLPRALQGLVTLDDLLEIFAEQVRALVLAIEGEQLRERKTQA